MTCLLVAQQQRALRTTTSLGMHNGLLIPDIAQMDAMFESLPNALEGMTIIQLSDIHASTLIPKAHIASIVKKVNA